jgi:tetrahydromethanopterin S-methyltransferase subunit C
MTLPLDLLIQFALGATTGVFANHAVGPRGPFVNRILVGLIASVALFVIPLALIRFHFWNDWTWLYLLSPTRHPAAAQIPAEAAYVSLLFLSVLAGYQSALRAATPPVRAAVIALPLVALVVSAIFLADRVFVFARFDEFVSARARPIIETPWAFVMFAAELAALIATVAVVRRLAHSAIRANPPLASARAR